jgi:hypothetical protein
MAAQSSVQVPDFDQAEAKTTAEILSALDETVATAKSTLKGRGDGRNLEGHGRRPESDGASSGCAAPVDHAQPLVSPPRTTFGVSQTPRCPGAVDLRTSADENPFTQ